MRHLQSHRSGRPHGRSLSRCPRGVGSIGKHLCLCVPPGCHGGKGTPQLSMAVPALAVSLGTRQQGSAQGQCSALHAPTAVFRSATSPGSWALLYISRSPVSRLCLCGASPLEFPRPSPVAKKRHALPPFCVSAAAATSREHKALLTARCELRLFGQATGRPRRQLIIGKPMTESYPT